MASPEAFNSIHPHIFASCLPSLFYSEIPEIRNQLLDTIVDGNAENWQRIINKRQLKTMYFIPFDSEDENVGSFLDSIGNFPLSFVGINYPDDYKNECIVFWAEKEIDSLYEYLLVYSVEDEEIGLPDYRKSRILTFYEIEL